MRKSIIWQTANPIFIFILEDLISYRTFQLLKIQSCLESLEDIKLFGKPNKTKFGLGFQELCQNWVQELKLWKEKEEIPKLEVFGRKN